jgi:hypothetical protein
METWATALFPWVAERDSNQLSFNQGDEILLIPSDDLDDDLSASWLNAPCWSTGELNGVRGSVQTNLLRPFKRSAHTSAAPGAPSAAAAAAAAAAPAAVPSTGFTDFHSALTTFSNQIHLCPAEELALASNQLRQLLRSIEQRQQQKSIL